MSENAPAVLPGMAIETPTRGLTAFTAALIFSLVAGQASAQITCSNASTGDYDEDGFTDLQECAGITLLDGTLFPGASDTTKARADRLDPNSKDLFVAYLRLSSGHLGALPDPFKDQTFHGIEFKGLSGLGITVHQLVGVQIRIDRIVSLASAQKAIQVVESLDTNGKDLGLCQWGTPLGLDGCTVFTQRAKTFINTTCDSAKDTTTDRNQVFLAYATFLILHETGHSVGGLAAEYNDRFGGYHYKAGAAVVMEQAASYSTKGGKCTWFISNGWNNTLDLPAVKLK